MAAPQWSGGKCKSVQQIKAWFRHNSLEERQEANHTNPHINKAMTKYNFTYRGLDYAGLCQAFDSRLAAVDMGRQSSGKNARVILQSVIVYLPEGLAEKDTDTKKRWFQRAGDIFEEQFGENFLEMQVDLDENHEYYDPEKKATVMSREHGHARLFPEVDGKLNAKKFSSRAAINGLNAALQAMSIKEFDCPMMDGSKKKGGQTVEQLKAKSEATQIIAEAEKTRQEATRTLQEAVKAAEGVKAHAEVEARKKATRTLQEAKTAADGIRADADRISQEAARQQKRIECDRLALNQRRGQLEAWERELDEREEALGEREAALQKREAVVASKEAILTAIAREQYERRLAAARQERQARFVAEAAQIAPDIQPPHGKRRGKIPPPDRGPSL